MSIGFPGPVLHDRPIAEPYNLGRGWVGFGYRAAFGRPVRVVNDAAMQALGGYKRGKMLFLGLGTGLGSALIVDGIVEPMELGHLPWKGTYEDYVGLRGLKRRGRRNGGRARRRRFRERERAMQLGMIGLGRMGANMVRRLIGGRPRVRGLRPVAEGGERARPGERARRLLARGLREEARDSRGRSG